MRIVAVFLLISWFLTGLYGQSRCCGAEAPEERANTAVSDEDFQAIVGVGMCIGLFVLYYRLKRRGWSRESPA